MRYGSNIKKDDHLSIKNTPSRSLSNPGKIRPISRFKIPES